METRQPRHVGAADLQHISKQLESLQRLNTVILARLQALEQRGISGLSPARHSKRVRQRPRCTYCQCFGHTEDRCRRKVVIEPTRNTYSDANTQSSEVTEPARLLRPGYGLLPA